MNREVEERIVAMYFDNQDFEKNAKTTIDTLGQLKEGLKLEDTSKGFEVFEKIGKSLNFDKAHQGLQKMKTTIGSMKNAVGNIFRIGQQPLHEAEGAFKTLNGYISKYVGFDIAGKIVNGVESAIRQLTVAPVSAGFKQYEITMDSVKTIMSSTGESIDVVSQHLDSMTEYANKTIYSLTDMTSNLGKFTNNGVKLGPAVKAMEGIANATADAGQGAQQASMAMYNVSQAIGVGKMTIIDWKSLENANIATVKLKETFLEMAALQGKIQKKVDKDGSISYLLTKDENGKALKESIQLTTANFREYLSKGWLDKETMLRTFEIYSGQIDQTTLESWGVHDKELQEKFMNLGQEALNAATQVRTFTKMMDALKESAQSGWAKSFELIFGNMEQGTALWTTINEELDGVLSKSAEARNSILQIWSGVSHDTSSQEEAIKEKEASIEELTKKYEQLEAAQKRQGKKTKAYAETQKQMEETKKQIEEYEREIANLKLLINDKKVLMDMEIVDSEGRSGRQILIDALLGKRNEKNEVIESGLIQLLKEIGTAFSEAFGDVFGKIDAQGLFDFTQRIANGIHKIVDWFGKLGDKNSRLTKLQKILKGFLGPIKLIVNILKIGFNLIKRIASPVIDFFIDAFASVSDFFEKLGDLKPGEILEHIGNGIKTAWDKVKKFFTPQDILDEKGNVTGKEIPFIKWLKDVWENLKKTVKKWVEDNGLSDAWSTITSWWETIKGTLEEGKNKLVEVWTSLKNWWEASGIKSFFDNVWKNLQDIWTEASKWFEPKLETGYRNGRLESWYSDPPIVTFFKKIYEDVQKAFDDLAEWWNDSGIPQFFKKIWDDVTGAFQPKVVSGYRNGRLESWYDDIPIVKFFKGIWEGIKNAYATLSNWWNESGIPQFFQSIWEDISGAFQPKVVSGYRNGRLESWYDDIPVVKFFKAIWDGVKEAYDGLSNWWNGSGIPQFFQKIWEDISEAFQPKVVSGYRNGRLESWYDDIPIVKFFKGIWEGVKQAYFGLSNWWEGSGIPQFFQKIWDDVSRAFQPTVVSGYRNGRLESWEEEIPIVRFFKAIWDGVKEAYDGLSNWWNESGIPQFFQKIWDDVSGAFQPKVVSGYRNGRLESWYDDPPVVTFLKNIFGSIKSAWDTIVSWEGWPAIGNFLSNTWAWITSLFAGDKKATGGASKDAKELAKENAKDVMEQAETIEENTSFVERVINSVRDFITQVVEKLDGVVLPEGISDFLKNLGDFLQGVLKVVGDIFGSAGRIASGKGNLGDWLTVALPILFTGLIQLFQMYYAKSISSLATTSPTKMFLELGASILAMAAAISIIANVPQDRLAGATAIVALISLVVGGILAAIATIKTSTALTNPTTPFERFATNLVNKLSIFGMLGLVLSKLPELIQIIAEYKKQGVENIGEDIKKIMEGIAILIGSLSIIGIIAGLLGSSKSYQAGSIMTAGVELMLMISAATIILTLLNSSIGALSGVVEETSGADLGHWLDKATTVFEGLGKSIAAFFGAFIGGFMGSMAGSYSGTKAETEMEGLKNALDSTSSISDEDLSSFSRIILAISNIQQMLPKPSNIIEWLTGNRLEQLGNQLPALGTGLSSFIGSMQPFKSEDIDKTLDSIRVLSLFATSMDTLDRLFARITTGGDSIHDLLDYPNHPELVQNLDAERLYQYQEAASTLVQIIKDSLTDSEGKITGIDFHVGALSIVEAITDALGLGKEAISIAVRNMINEGLEGVNEENFGSKVFKFPNAVQEYYDQLNGKLHTEDGKTIDFGQLITQAFGTEADQQKWLEQISSLTGNVEEKITGMKTSYQDLFSDTSWLTMPTVTDAEGNEQDFLVYFQEQLKTISDTVNQNPLEVKITPVWNFDENFSTEKFMEQLGLHSIELPVGIDTGSLKVNFEGLSSELDMLTIQQKLDNIAWAVSSSGSLQSQRIDNLGAHMDGIANEVARLKLYLDTGALVGGIIDDVDRQLYDRSVIGSRVGTTVTDFVANSLFGH